MGTVVWSTPAMCMVPTAETVHQGKYVTSGGRVKFEVGQFGSITFVAAVQVSLPEGRYVLRAHLERATPDLLGASIALRRRRQ